MRESTVERYLHREVTRAGGTTRKWKSPGRKGVPDRIVIWKGAVTGSVFGNVHFVETKAPGKGPREDQAREHKRLRRLGCLVLVLDTKAKVDRYVGSYGK